jgi:hypothetical protein
MDLGQLAGNIIQFCDVNNSFDLTGPALQNVSVVWHIIRGTGPALLLNLLLKPFFCTREGVIRIREWLSSSGKTVPDQPDRSPCTEYQGWDQ